MAAPRRSVLQLSRLETLTDVVYAIVIWRLFMIIPRPGLGDEIWSTLHVYVVDEWIELVLVLIGLTFSIVYWIQSNALLGSLERTDGLHTVFSIAQLFSLLIFLYSLGLGVELGGSVGTRAFESVAAAAVGIFGALGWQHAIRHRRLLHPDVTDHEAKTLAKKITAEPITALVTLPMAFVGAVFWEVSWFVYPLVAKLVRQQRLGRAR